MTRDELIRLCAEAECKDSACGCIPEGIERFAALVAEREGKSATGAIERLSAELKNAEDNKRYGWDTAKASDKAYQEEYAKRIKAEEELAALKKAQVEPVAETVADVTNTGYVYVKVLKNRDIPAGTKLYLAPPVKESTNENQTT